MPLQFSEEEEIPETVINARKGLFMSAVAIVKHF